jgi:hypothetical protein
MITSFYLLQPCESRIDPVVENPQGINVDQPVAPFFASILTASKPTDSGVSALVS